MSFLEWVGVIAIVLFILKWALNIYRSRNQEKCSLDPEFSRRQFEFDRMTDAFGKLRDIRDMKCDSHNEVVSNVQLAIDDVLQLAVPLPKNAFASDYRSKYVDYTVIQYLASNIISSELRDIKPAEERLIITLN